MTVLLVLFTFVMPPVLFLSGCGIVVYQVFIWLQTGVWPALRVIDACIFLGFFPTSDWVGLQKIINWIATWPLSHGLMVAAVIILVLGWRRVIWDINLPAKQKNGRQDD
jgi:hypothetical protein